MEKILKNIEIFFMPYPHYDSIFEWFGFSTAVQYLTIAPLLTVLAIAAVVLLICRKQYAYTCFPVISLILTWSIHLFPGYSAAEEEPRRHLFAWTLFAAAWLIATITPVALFKKNTPYAKIGIPAIVLAAIDMAWFIYLYAGMSNYLIRLDEPFNADRNYVGFMNSDFAGIGISNYNLSLILWGGGIIVMVVFVLTRVLKHTKET